MEEKLLYELEYQVNEIRKSRLSQVKHEIMTIKELLDLGFDNTFIMVDNEWFNLGYKWKVVDNKTNELHTGYESSDFGELNEKKLNCKVSYVDHEYSDGDYLQVSVRLDNNEDSKYFHEEN